VLSQLVLSKSSKESARHWVRQAIMNQAPALALPVPERERSSAAGKNCIAGGKDKRGDGVRP
jgi:hypothetical protein